MGVGKLMEFEAKISDVVQINPLFSVCNVRVMYTGKNRNRSFISKESVERALPTLKNIPIVGEYSEESRDFKGHGGKIDLDTFKYIHTTKPYGVVPESATYEWEEVDGKEYLTIKGCYLWTGRYEEALQVIEQGKGQSMEIEVTNGYWDDREDVYVINDFVFSALCILGDSVEPAFEDARIYAYTLDKDSFKAEFNQMLKELKESLQYSCTKGVNEVTLQELLDKYSLTVEDLTEKGIDVENITLEELEGKIKELFQVNDPEPQQQDSGQQPQEPSQNDGEPVQEPVQDGKGGNEPSNPQAGEGDGEKIDKAEFEAKIKEYQNQVSDLEAKLKQAQEKIDSLTTELEDLKQFKLNTLRKEHEEKAKDIFVKFGLSEDEVADIDVHKFTLEEIEEKCYAILGKKLMNKKLDFSVNNGVKVKVNLDLDKSPEDDDPYGDLFEKYNKK